MKQKFVKFKMLKSNISFFRSIHFGGFVGDDASQSDGSKGLLQDQDDGAEAILRQAELGSHRSETARSSSRWELYLRLVKNHGREGIKEKFWGGEG